MHFFHQATRINFPAAAAAGGDEGEGGMREEKPFAFFICEKAHAGEKREKEEEPLSLLVLCSSLRVCVPLWKYRKSFSAQPKSHFIFFPSLCAILERREKKKGSERRVMECSILIHIYI